MGHMTQCDDNYTLRAMRQRRMHLKLRVRKTSNNGRARVQNNAAINECLTWACKQQKNVCTRSAREGMTCVATQRCVARKTKSVGFVFARLPPLRTASAQRRNSGKQVGLA